MSKKRSKRSAKPSVHREVLPADLEERLRAVWRKVGPSIGWCDGLQGWLQSFCMELRPYRETFYWEAVADIVLDYRSDHPEISQERVLTDCLVATQSEPDPSEEDDRLTVFRKAWAEILDRSRERIEQCVRADLALAEAEGNAEAVAELYSPGNRTWDRTDRPEP